MNDVKPVAQNFQEHFSSQGERLGVQSSQQTMHAAWFGSCSREQLKGQISKSKQLPRCSEMAPMGR